MDYKADRIEDYTVYSLGPGMKEYRPVIDIKVSHLSTNGTMCSSWLVGSVHRTLTI